MRSFWLTMRNSVNLRINRMRSVTKPFLSATTGDQSDYFPKAGKEGFARLSLLPWLLSTLLKHVIIERTIQFSDLVDKGRRPRIYIKVLVCFCGHVKPYHFDISDPKAIKYFANFIIESFHQPNMIETGKMRMCLTALHPAR